MVLFPMKVGDLVKYKAYNSHLQRFVGVIIAIHTGKRGTRAKMMWNDPIRNWMWDWVTELEIVNENR